MEADQFSIGLLTPRKLFIPAIKRAGEGLAAIEHLAGICKTSLTATAIRYAQCSSDPVAVILSMGRNVDYCFMSDTLKEIDGIDWLRKRAAISADTPTFAFNQDANNVRSGARLNEKSNLQDWFGGSRSIEMREDVIGLGGYGKTLTVLYNIDIPDDDEESENDSDGSYGRRFYR